MKQNPEVGNRRLKMILVAVAAAALVPACIAAAQTAGQGGKPFLNTSEVPYYAVEHGAVVRRNGERYHNRPLYANHIRAYVLAGDQPNLRLVQDPYAYGSMQMAVSRAGVTVPFHEFTRRESRFEPNRMTWRLEHDSFPGLKLELRAAPTEHGPGMVLELTVSGAAKDDRLIWAFGGTVARASEKGPSIAWDLDPLGHPELMERGLVPEDCRNNRVEPVKAGFLLWPPEHAAAVGQVVRGRCSLESTMLVADASHWTDLEPASNDAPMPIALGHQPLADGMVYWMIDVVESPSGAPDVDDRVLSEQFHRGWSRCVDVGAQVRVQTPSESLNIVASCAATALDGVYIPPAFNHGGMLWNVPFPGWRTLYGPTAYGWADEVKAQAKYYLASQVTEDTHTSPKADPNLGYGQEAPDSRFYGKGRITQDTAFYNFQSQFFDMLVHAWRWTGDDELEALLRPALELHLEWQQECFDPDNDGLYESYINTWPTDCVWFNGGGTPEETSYAYRGHRAAADMARRAGDAELEDAHRERAEQIRASLMAQLWLKDKGYLGAYRDQSGHRRVHSDAWLYSIVCPIDAGMLTPLEELQALHYTEWGLERVPVPFGGVRCWTSNWVPSVWSVRELYPGDNYHLALACYQAGQPDAAWELLQGNMLAYALDGGVPGSLGVPNGGTDFNDVSSMFARVVVEGLFGIRPDYPNDAVTIAPGFPLEWPHASIETPEFGVTFRRNDGSEYVEDQYDLRVNRPANLNLETYVSARRLDSVMVNGEAVEPRLEPAVGRTQVIVPVGETSQASVTLRWRDAVQSSAETALSLDVAQQTTVTSPRGPISSFHDPQGTFETMSADNGQWLATAAKMPGKHLVLAEISTGELTQLERIAVTVRDRNAEEEHAQFVLREAPDGARWEPLDISAFFNGDVRAIYQQEYLEPRPATCSVRIGSDGYSPWCFYYWGKKPPEVTLDLADALVDADGNLVAHGVPFQWPKAGNNIAFTSLWDNWPDSVTVPVNAEGQGLWLLVCGSTNPMQTRIANAVIRLAYAHGSSDVLELIPPLNFWSLCPLGGVDYDYTRDAFCLPEVPPMTVQLGDNCCAVLLGCRLRAGQHLQSVTLETLSQDVVIGLMGISLMR